MADAVSMAAPFECLRRFCVSRFYGCAVSRCAVSMAAPFECLRRFNGFARFSLRCLNGCAVSGFLCLRRFYACGVSMASPFLAALFQVSMCFARFSLRCF